MVVYLQLGRHTKNPKLPQMSAPFLIKGNERLLMDSFSYQERELSYLLGVDAHRDQTRVSLPLLAVHELTHTSHKVSKDQVHRI